MRDKFRQTVKRIVERLGLLGVAFRLHEFFQSYELGNRRRSEILHADDGLPIPHPKLIVLVGGHTNSAAFLLGGQEIARCIRDMLTANGSHISQMKAILDFGCGCGRVMRYWRFLPSRVVLRGTDYNRTSIDWCRRNLTFAKFDINRLAPPLDYQSGSFDLVYAFSVFTHLSPELQLAWISELTRITAPGGYLFVTLHGDAFRATMTLDEQRLFDSGQLVVRHSTMAGSNLCAAFHPRNYVLELFVQGLQVIEYSPARLGQDVLLLRKPYKTT